MSTSLIHQNLTPEAAALLNEAIAEATRRCNSLATPIHLAEKMMNGLLRQACMQTQSVPNPVQCGVLELPISVALGRIPKVRNAEPTISNALTAVLNRAHAHRRQPVQVDIEQLTISTLEDPAVSCLLREAGFCSQAVKAGIVNNPSRAEPGPGSG